MSRLLLFVRLVRKNPPSVLHLLQQATFGEESWAACLQQDLTWLAVSEKFRTCSSFSLTEWIGFFNSHSESANSIRKFCASPWVNISTHFPAIQIVGLNHTHSCGLCPYKCDSNQQLALHLFKHHGIKDNIRLYVSGTRCPICLTEFWQREVLLNHIRRGRTPCKRQVLLRGPVLTESQSVELDLELRPFFQKQHRCGLRRHAVDTPCMRVQGPKMKFIYGPARMFGG